MNWKSATALLALTFVGMGSLVYLLLRQEEGFKGYFFLKPSKNVILEVKIPKESLGIVMGRNGNTIKEIESQSNVKIYIKEEYSACGNYKICIIQGTPEDAQYAESLIHEIIVGQPLIETYEMFVPAQACGRIIGKNGDNIRLISRNSNAKIIIENPPASQLERKIIIKGTSEQISTAKFLIEQKVEDHFQFHSKIESHMSNRPLRNELKYILPTKGVSKDLDTHPHKERFIATGSNGLLDIYMSTVESPDRFWVQIAGPGIDELDKLIEQLTDYYTKDENKMRHKLEEVKCGQIVAAPCINDCRWYRAEVQGIQDDSEDPDILLYYVDYGFCLSCKKSSVHELRTDFLHLRFQAIECILAKVKPRDSSWTENATEYLKYITEWKPLLAKIHTYKNRPTRIKREGSPIPCVELYVIDSTSTVNVAQQLVNMELAFWEEESESLGVAGVINANSIKGC